MHTRRHHSLVGRCRRTAPSIVVALVVATVVACGPGSPDGGTQVAAGALDGKPWTARAGLAGASGVCLEVHLEGAAQDNRLCGLQGGESGLWRFDVEGGTFVAGTRSDPQAAAVRLTLADGSQVPAPLTEARDVPGLRFFVLVIPLATPLQRIDTLDTAGTVIATIAVEK